MAPRKIKPIPETQATTNKVLKETRKAPLKKETKCKSVLTIPQISGTCWFNSLIMAFFHSEKIKAACKLASKSWKAFGEKHPKLARVYKIFNAILNDYQVFKDEDDRATKYTFFENITPEHTLEMLYNLQPDAFAFHPGMYNGFNVTSYIMQFSRLLNLRTIMLEKDPDSSTYYISGFNHFRFLKTDMGLYLEVVPYTPEQIQELISESYYDMVIVYLGSNTNAPHNELYKSIQVPVVATTKAGGVMPTSFTLNGGKYVVDACILASMKDEQLVCKPGHSIAGITCGTQRYVYNGWVSRTRDTAVIASQKALGRDAYPCELMPFDWATENTDFCLNPIACKLSAPESKDANAVADLCFNFSKSERLCVYVNADVKKRPIDINTVDNLLKNALPTRSVKLAKSYSDETKRMKASLKSTRKPRIAKEPSAPKNQKKQKDGITDPKPQKQPKPEDQVKLRKDTDTCIRQVANFSHIKPSHMFDSKKFEPQDLLRLLPTSSPKLELLLKKIEELDERDQREEGKVYKHFIYSDVKARGYGAKIIASALIAKGWKLVYDKNLVINDESKLKESSGKNFALLSSTSTYGKPSPATLKKKLITLYNKRPDNVNGDLARIIVLDSGFKEGIDLFDVKYVHVFEPPISMADQKQVIGRATRTCGQKGLRFDPTQGWPLNVFLYDIKLPEIIQDRKYPVETMNELYMSLSGIDLRLNNMAYDLEKHVMSAAIDKSLNKSVHDFDMNKKKSRNKVGGADVTSNTSSKSDSNSNSNSNRDPEDSDNDNDNGNESDTQSQSSSTDAIEDAIAMKSSPQSSPREIIVTKPTAKRSPSNSPGWVRNRGRITKKFKRFTWPPAVLENKCDNNNNSTTNSDDSSSKFLKFNPSQEFARHYFTPKSPGNGILMNFSTGVGKTCAAIATASSAFEEAGYTIVWVTRTTLKHDLWKNMFEQSCNVQLRKKLESSGVKLPKDMTARKRMLSRSWRIPPLSYKQFTNLLQGKNEFYQKLVETNGKDDPLKNTLLIIDEAHKLFNAEDLSKIERPDTRILAKMLQNSYKNSGKDSVKVMLLTATPITNKPMDFMRLMNLILPSKNQLPTDFDELLAHYLDAQGRFTRQGAAHLKATLAGHVLYLDRSKDAREFAQPKISHLYAPMSKRANNLAFNTKAEFKEKYTVKGSSEILQLERSIVDLEREALETKEAVKALKTKQKEVTKQEKVYAKELKVLASALKKAQHPTKGNPEEAARIQREQVRVGQAIEALKRNSQSSPLNANQVKAKNEAVKQRINEIKAAIKRFKSQVKSEAGLEKNNLAMEFSQERMMKEKCGRYIAKSTFHRVST